MNYPTVTERKVRLEPVVHDTFIDKLPLPMPHGRARRPAAARAPLT